MVYTFDEESEKYFLKDILKFKDIEKLGNGAQSHVWKATNSNGTKLAVKLGFGDTSDFKAEQLLNKYKPDILKKENLNHVFKGDTKLEDIHKRYYKYTIIFKNDVQQDEAFIKMLNYDLKKKNFNITFEKILEYAQEREPNINNINLLSNWLVGSSARLRLCERIKKEDTKVDESYLNPLMDMLRSYKDNKYYVSTAILADKSLDKYLTQLEKNQNIEFAINEVKKLAKHILKALSALHHDGIAHRDLHVGNITRTVVNPEGKSQKIKYNLIDFGAIDNSANNNENIRRDLRSLGYGVLIPVFYQLFDREVKLSADNYWNFDKISNMEKLEGMDKTFIDFLKKLNDGFKDSSEALNHDFIKKK